MDVGNFQGRDDLGLALLGDGQREVLGDFLILPTGGGGGPGLLGRLGGLLRLGGVQGDQLAGDGKVRLVPVLLAVSAGLRQRHFVHLGADFQHTGLFQRLAAVEPVHKLVLALLALAENDRLFQPGLLDAVDQVLVVLPGRVFDIGAREGLDVGQLDKPQVSLLLRFTLAALGRGSTGSLGVRCVLGGRVGLLALAALDGGIAGGLGGGRVLGRLGRLLALTILGRGGASGLGGGHVLGRLGGLFTLAVLAGGNVGGLGGGRVLGRLGGFLTLVSLGRGSASGLGVRDALGRLGGLLTLVSLDGSGAGGLGVRCVLERFGRLLALGGSGRGRCTGDRSAERTNQRVVFFGCHNVFLLILDYVEKCVST